MIESRIKKTNVKIKENFKNNKIVFCFLLFSSNKFVEFLLVKLNSFFIKFEYKKKKTNINKRFIELSVSLENYVTLKKELIFEIDKEQLKFKFLYVILKEKKLSVSFFEENYLNNFDKKQNFIVINKFISVNLLLKNIFFLKVVFLFYFIFFNLINLIRSSIYIHYSKLFIKNVNYSSGS